MLSPYKRFNDNPAVWRGLFQLRRGGALTLQAQVRQVITQAVLDQRLPADSLLPPSRTLAAWLGISRNTVTAVYHAMTEQGCLRSLPRIGHVVNRIPTPVSESGSAPDGAESGSPVDWPSRLDSRSRKLHPVLKERAWQSFPYPFVYGQFDPTLFPIAQWREAAVLSQRSMSIREWAGDRVDSDDPMLLEEIQRRLLSRRGILASPDQILVTVGAQQALYLVASLLMHRPCTMGVEHPGYPDIWNVCRMFQGRLVGIPVDEQGMKVPRRGCDCQYVYVTPSQQNPTTTRMSLRRRRELLHAAADRDFVIIEDDHDSELGFAGEAIPAIRSMDRGDRVIYVGSLSKTLAPGLRIGFLVGNADLIAQARAVRRLMLRHPPTNNQRAVALFLSLGHHDALIRTLTDAYRARAGALANALRRHLPQVRFQMPAGGSAIWAAAPRGTDMAEVARVASSRGLLFDQGELFFFGKVNPRHFFRMGYSSIPVSRIEEGVKLLARILREQRWF
jgi:GntR family transcriptional regulator/MocR family aminotransferase